MAGRRGACTWRWGSDPGTPPLESGMSSLGLRPTAGRCRKSLSSSLQHILLLNFSACEDIWSFLYEIFNCSSFFYFNLIASQLLFQLRLQRKMTCFCPPLVIISGYVYFGCLSVDICNVWLDDYWWTLAPYTWLPRVKAEWKCSWQWWFDCKAVNWWSCDESEADMCIKFQHGQQGAFNCRKNTKVGA